MFEQVVFSQGKSWLGRKVNQERQTRQAEEAVRLGSLNTEAYLVSIIFWSEQGKSLCGGFDSHRSAH